MREPPPSDSDSPAAGPPPLPGAVKAASIILIVLAVLYVLGALVYFQASGDEAFLAESETSATAWRAQAIINLALGLAQLVIALQIRRGNNAARMAALVLCGVGLVFGVLSLPAGIIAAVMNGLVLYLLGRRPESKAFFGRPVTTGPE